MNFLKKLLGNNDLKTKINVYRISYRLRNGNIPLIAEMLIKSRKEKSEIDFARVVKEYWIRNKQQMQFDAILVVDKVGEE